tara:strand:+ start:219 stop:773 length:555 start_codon:yes stop_codon:yes gene_type:complete
MIQKIKITIAALLFLVISSCSFRSTQYDYLRQIIISNQKDIPNPEWIIDWSGVKYDAYAINHQDAIYFATTNEHLIGFRDKRIFLVRGFNAIAAEIKIESDNNRIIYYSDNKLKRIDLCGLWENKIHSEDKIQIENQICFVGGSDYNQYENNIYYNQNMIIGLIFKIHPEYPPIKLRLKSNDIK